jgi:hypothetical protein
MRIVTVTVILLALALFLSSCSGKVVSAARKILLKEQSTK